MTDARDLRDTIITAFFWWIVFSFLMTGIIVYQLVQIKNRLPAPQAGQVEVQK